MLSRRFFVLAALFALAVLPGETFAAKQYLLTELPSIDGEFEAYAAGINNSGEIVGHVIDSFGHAHASYWGVAGDRLLPEIGAPFSQAFRINDAGQIVGKAGIPSGAVHATLWNSFTPVDIGTLTGGGDSFATDINDHGVVSGSSTAEVGQSAFTWTEDGGFVDYGNTDPPFRLAVAGFNGINNTGLMVGTTYVILEPYHAAFAREGQKGLTDLSPVGRISVGMAMAVNDAGVIVGYQNQPGENIQAAIFHEDGTFEQLGTLGLDESWALDVNQQNEIVGRAFGFEPGGQLTTKAFVTDGRDVIDILEHSVNPDGWTLVEATAINDHGVIVGNAVFNGELRAFMATPVPEPGTITLMGAAAVALFALRRHARFSR